jgi:hypothetical protein
MTIALIGPNETRASDPTKSLWPGPVDTVGWHLFCMLRDRLGVNENDYLRAFHRYSLGTQRFYHQDNMRREWIQIENHLTTKFSTIILVGRTVKLAAGLPLPELYFSRTIITLPLPSKYSLFYKNKRNREIVGLVLGELYLQAVTG